MRADHKAQLYRKVYKGLHGLHLRITQDRKMQREGLGACAGSEAYFETKHNCTEKCTMGSMARAVSERVGGAARE